jgi:protein-tyrosine phosphatase
MPGRKKVRVLFVCLANICRSPTAEGVFRQYVKQAGLAKRISADSAGTSNYRLGEAPDVRACDVAFQRGYDLSGLRARQIEEKDFADFDYIVAMDIDNIRALATLCPREHGRKVSLLTDYCSKPACTIPDPYTGGPEDFVHMLNLVEDAAAGLLRHIADELAVADAQPSPKLAS